jgi:SnoaL-like polyketide cyclase
MQLRLRRTTGVSWPEATQWRPMTELEHPVERALRLWSEPTADAEARLAAFRSVYADPVVVNGVETPLRELADRAAMMQAGLADIGHEILERIDTPGRSAFAFRITGRLDGPFTTPLGVLAPNGRTVEVFGMDIFLISDDLVTGVYAIADYLGLLMREAAVELVQP